MMRRAIVAWLPREPLRALRWCSQGPDRITQDIHESYLEFWDHIRFRKGWATPPFMPDAVQGELGAAAKISAEIMKTVDERKNGPSFRKRGGESVAFLSGVQYNPEEHRPKFVRELVHSTLSDARGYIDGLTEELVDKEIARLNAKEQVAAVAGKVESVMEEVQELAAVMKNSGDGLSPEVATLLRQLHHALRDPMPPTKVAEEHEEVSVKAPEPEPAASEAAKETPIDVTAYQKAVEKLQNATKVEWDSVKKDPASYVKELEAVQDRCTASTSQLMKDLLALEQSITSSVSDGQTPDAGVKEQVHNIHNLLGAVDEVSRRIHVLKTATIQEKERQAAGEKQEEKKPEAKQPPRGEKQKPPQQQKQQQQQRVQQPSPRRQQQQPPPPSQQQQQQQLRPMDYLNQLAQVCLDKATWEKIPIEPEFQVRNGHDYCLISAYVPTLRKESVGVNINYDLLTVSGTCAPTKMEVWRAIEPIVAGFKRNPQAMASILARPPLEVAQMLSQGKWGQFSKEYTLPAPVPPSAVRAQVANNVLSVAIPYTH
eukprot:TRINITY_DN5567_c0_g3_i1.p1 TRINITY_DN5567_c0_g3~~TRINITY_DN5567_c0_g3_i1.p1  ORF type:complete len:542 (+),score=226.53 TRINITY_DN5567_c0_g3_i1:51-1676(+)